MASPALTKARDGERPSDRAAKLLLRRRSDLTESILCCQTGRTIDIKGAAVKVICPGFCYRINHAASWAAKFGVIAWSYDLEFFNRALRNGERLIRTLAPAQAAKEWIVVIGAIDLHITVNTPLSDEWNLTTRGINLGCRCRQHKILEAAAIDGQLTDWSIVDVGGGLNLGSLDVGASGD